MPEIEYTPEETKELNETLSRTSPFNSASVRDRFDLAVLKKHRDNSRGSFNAWAGQLRRMARGPDYFGPPDEGDPVEKEIREAEVRFEEIQRERTMAEEARKKAEAQTRRREKATAVIGEWIKAETPVILTQQFRAITGHVVGKALRFSGFKPDSPAWLLVGTESGDKRDLFFVFDLVAVNWTFYSEGKDHRLVISTQGDGEISISDHPLTGEEFDAMFREAVKTLSE